MGEKAHWDGIFQQRVTGEHNWHQDYPELSLQFIESIGINADEPILDVGGGTSLLVDNLLLRGYSRLAMVDISAAAIEQSRQRLGLNADQIDWYESDIRYFDPPHPFSVWHDRAVFHFFVEDADRQAYINTVRKTLQPEGHMILATFSPFGPDHCSGLPVQRYDATALETTMGDGFELIESWPEEHLTPSGELQPFIFNLFVMHA